MEHASIRLTGATTRWQAARICLSKAIQEFSEATSVFTRAILNPTPLDEVEFDLESRLEGLDLELQRLALDDKAFTAAYAQVKETRSASKRIVPIHRLPPDVLSHIFSIAIAWADDCCNRNGVPSWAPVGSGLGWKTRTVSLTSVCATWRRIIVDTPLYWSHIDVRLAFTMDKWWYVPTEYSKLCLQRANNTPLEIHIYLIEVAALRGGLSASRPVECFHRRIISSISFELGWQQEIANSVLDVWMSTLTNAATSLKIRTNAILDVEEFPIAHMHEHFHTLDLVGIKTDWSQIRFPWLVDLSLGGGNCLTMDQLRDVIVASPALRTLIIGGGNATAKDLVEFENSRVELGRLVFLGLRNAGELDVILLLQMIRPAPECTALSIGFPRRPLPSPDQELLVSMWETMRTFCIQYKVSQLSLDVPSPESSPQHSLAHLLHSLTNLHTLALWNNMLHVTDPATSQLGESISVYEYMAPPTLQRLYLNDSIIPAELWRMVSASSIRWLRMDYCFCLGSKDDSQALYEWLERSVPEFHLHGESERASSDNIVCSSDCELPWWLSVVNAGVHRQKHDSSRLYM